METVETKKTSRTSKITRAFVISLVILLLASLVNWGFISAWGKISISRLSLVGDDGLHYSAIVYVPDGASNETPAPAVMFLHGGSGNGRNMENWAVEYARRGFVVISPDSEGSGDSECSASIPQAAPAFAFANYLVDMPIVDKERIVLAGHSFGCTCVYALWPTIDAHTMIFAGGAWRAVAKEGATPFDGNILSIMGTVEHRRDYDYEYSQTAACFESNGLDLQGEALEWGRLYGSFEDGNARQAFLLEKQTHEGALVNTTNLALQLDFIQKAMDVPNYIDANDQISVYKDFTGLFGMLAFVGFLICLFLFLMEKIPAFSSIKQPLPRNIGLRGKGLAISIAAAAIFPLIVLYTGAFGLWGLLDENTFIFPVAHANRGFSIVIGINAMSIIMLALFTLVDGKKHGATLRDFGLTSEGSKKIDFVLIGKAFILAVIVAVIGWTYLSWQGAVLGTDFYAWFFGYKPFPAAIKLKYYIPYIIVWMACFIVTSIGLNVERRLPSTGSETKDTIIATVFNTICCCFTVTLMVIVQNQLQLRLPMGTPALGNFGADMTRIWGMPVGMAISGGGHTILYRKTGSIWPGVFLMGIVCALGCVLYGSIKF